MPKVYLDWNIYSYLAKGENDELYNILNQSNLILIYSIYHLSDVRKSIVKYGGINEYTRNELKTLSHLTNNRCLFREATGLVQSGIINPEEYLDSLEIQDNLINNFNLDAIFDALDAPEYQDIFDKIKQELRRIELPDILLDYNLFEGNKSNSLDDFLKFSADSYIDLTTTDSFKGMRSGFQKTGISHKSFHSNQNPLKVLAKIFEERGYGDMGETMFAFKMEKDEWFDQIVSLYLTLDFCGYRSDSINVNNRKSQTFLNLLNDAYHAAFASRCEFYITDDRKGRDKTQAVYEYLGIKTKILNSKGFNEHYATFLGDRDFEDFYSRIKKLLDYNSSFYLSEAESASGDDMYELDTEFYLFNFFNKIYLPKNNSANPIVVLGKEMTANTKYFILFEELVELVKVLTDYLGDDEHGRSEFKSEESLLLNSTLRRWLLNELIIELVVYNEHIQLYFKYIT